MPIKTPHGYLTRIIQRTYQSSSPKNLTPYEQFLIAEYNNIAQAHFNMVSTISNFFRYYLLIVSLPIPAFLILIRPLEPIGRQFTTIEQTISALILFLIAIVGFCVLGYILNLRFDAILYARTVNGVRSYFSRSSDLPLDEKQKYTVLPRSIQFPPYLENVYFLFVVLAFSFLDAFYLSVGTWLYFQCCESGIVLLFFTFFALHLSLYYGLARYRENFYLRTNIIGVDIDGVLNKHREQFCKILREVRGKDINPSSITYVPVHKCENLNLSEDDEYAVFNHPAYWAEMPEQENAASILTRLRNQLSYKIMLFTHRDWPQVKNFPKGLEEDYSRLWERIDSQWKKSGKAIESITVAWLENHQVPYDSLIIEKGNIHTTDPRSRFKNRFVKSQRKNIRIFVEDELFKAIKLCYICEIVFLIDHPYNQAPARSIPDNLIRVKSWEEIHDYIRETL